MRERRGDGDLHDARDADGEAGLSKPTLEENSQSAFDLGLEGERG